MIHGSRITCRKLFNSLQVLSKSMASATRFQLYVKAGKDGQSLGDCPFSQRANMFARMNLNKADINLVFVDTSNKPDYFLKLNPEGKVPVMVDNKENRVIADSGDITKYISEISSSSGSASDENLISKATDACSGVFPKFAAMMKNKDASKNEDLKDALTTELRKLDDFLNKNKTRGKYLTDDELCEVDCQILPKLKHIQVAGKKYKDYDIPAEFTALHGYIKDGHGNEIFKLTCPDDEQFIWGWGKHM